MQLFPTEVDESHLDTFLALADGFVHETSAEMLRPYINKDFSDDQLREYVKTVTCPSKIPEIRTFIRESLNFQSVTALRLFSATMGALSLRILSPALTKTTKLVTEMTNEEKEKLLLSWRDSPLEAKNKLFCLCCRMTLLAFVAYAPLLHFDAIDYPRKEGRALLYEDYVEDPFEFKMKQPPLENRSELYLPDVDAIIIGSGAGAGVVAHTLARDGLKCLVLEKGKYYKFSETNFNDAEGFKELYEKGGAVVTENSQMVVLAGATFGGGTTVNWSACLKTPFKTRSEWFQQHGLDFVATEEYDKDVDYVFKQMGATLENITHSKSNQALCDGCEKLGYKARAIDQNTGGHTNHSCGFCHVGCKWGVKQGSLANWFRDAAGHGTEFMDQVTVERILHNDKHIAVGLECKNSRNGSTFFIRGPKKYIVSGGALHTPVLLQKSGFKNKHIGRNLKLHPITGLTAVWDEKKTDPHHNSIMTAVCQEAEDLDGKGYGTKIETLVHAPFVEISFIPWHSSDEIRKDMMKYQSTSSFIMLTRDTLSGTVTYDSRKPDMVKVDYAVNKCDRSHMAKAILITMDIAYIEGAVEIIHPFYKAGRFRSAKPKDKRSINDGDYQAWRKHVEGLELTPYGLSYGSAHQMSSCRMSGKGSGDGACDKRGRLYECDNVYVADASVMPTASGANPMISTMALARHIAKGISKDLKPTARL